MAVRAIDPFQTRLAEFGDARIDVDVVDRALEVVRQLAPGVRLPYPVPLSDGGLVLEWDKGQLFADVELRPDLTIVVTVVAGDRNTRRVYESVDDLAVFIDWVDENF